MNPVDIWPWLALAVLGAFHGINPAMGWLFAVARGFQEKRRGAVLGALIPIAVGHEASLGAVVVLVSGFESVVTPDLVRLVAAALLIGFGVFKFVRPRAHPRWVGMRISQGELVVWSFLMSSAHGAGLMLLPVLLRLGVPAADDDAGLALMGTSVVQDALALFIHTGAMILVMGVVALVVYQRLGVGVLRRLWVNLDLVWAGAVGIAGVATLFS